MKKIYDLDEWQFNKNTTDDTRAASVSIHLKYIDLKEVADLTPKERMGAIDNHFKKNFSKLLETSLFKTFQRIGNNRRPRGVEATILFKDIKQLVRHNFIENIFINSVQGGKRYERKSCLKFFCIKMTIAIQIEGVTNGLQTYEERYILIKAKTSDEAFRKIERQKKKYEEPYLNPRGQFVRWKIESLDDCYVTDIITCDDLNNREGVEVFSILKRRRLTKEKYWNGKLDS